MDDIVTIDTCDQGHRFAKLPDHPKRDGYARCPHCLAIGLDRMIQEQHDFDLDRKFEDRDY